MVKNGWWKYHICCNIKLEYETKLNSLNNMLKKTLSIMFVYKDNKMGHKK